MKFSFKWMIKRGVSSLSASVALVAIAYCAEAERSLPTPISSPVFSTPVGYPALMSCDQDKDGFRANTPQCNHGPDCDDTKPGVKPAATEGQCGDSADNDCDGRADCDDPDCANQATFVKTVALAPNGLCCREVQTTDGLKYAGKATVVSNDVKNCGSCGHQCPAHNLCVDGKCVSGCQLTETICFSGPIPEFLADLRDHRGDSSAAMEYLVNLIKSNPECALPGLSDRDLRAQIRLFTEENLDNRGKPIGSALRVFCIGVKF